jgi:hypothetical protein
MQDFTPFLPSANVHAAVSLSLHAKTGFAVPNQANTTNAPVSSLLMLLLRYMLPPRCVVCLPKAQKKRKRFRGRPVAACIETSRGHSSTRFRGTISLVLFSVNPATLAKYRRAFKPSRAKSDPTDAQIALEILLNHRDELKVLRPQSEGIRRLVLLLEERRMLVNDQTRITNRLISTLKHYYPQAHESLEDKGIILLGIGPIQDVATR